MRTAVITISTSVAAGETEDASGQALAELATRRSASSACPWPDPESAESG